MVVGLNWKFLKIIIRLVVISSMIIVKMLILIIIDWCEGMFEFVIRSCFVL